MITVKQMIRLEVWSSLQCAGGQRLAVVREVVACAAHVQLTGDDRLTVTVPLTSSAASLLTSGRVLRVVESDAVWDEWVLVEDARAAGQSAGDQVTVTAAGPEQLIARRCLVGQPDGQGGVVYDFESLSLTPTAHVNAWLLPALNADPGNWLALGVVDPTAPCDLTLASDGPLSFLRKLADVAGAELQFRRNGTVGYYVDLLNQIGSTAPLADFRPRKNLPELSETRSLLDTANRVYPLGAAQDGVRATMAGAVWQIATRSADGLTLGLADPAGGDGPLLADDQLNGRYLQTAAGARTQIADSVAATQALVFGAAPAVVVGDLVTIVADAAGSDLAWLDSPSDQAAAGGIYAASLDVADVAPTNNLIPNPACRTWPGALPTGWAAVGAAVTAKQTAAPFLQTAGASIHVQTTTDGQGVLSPAGAIHPTATKPYGSGFATVWVVSGQVRVELVVTKQDNSTVVIPIAPSVATSSLQGAFESLGVSGQDLNALGAKSVAVRVVQHGATAAEFYVDGAQTTNTPEQQPFLEGCGATRLWQAANEQLRTKGGLALSFSSAILDRARLDPSKYAGDSDLVLGGQARVTDDRLGVAITTRVVELVRDYRDIGKSGFTLSTKPDDLAGTDARPRKAPRLPVAVPDPSVPYVPIDVRYRASESGTLATIALEVTDPQGNATAVEIATAVGGADFPRDGNGNIVYTPVALVGGIATSAVALQAKQPSQFAWRVRGRDAVGDVDAVLRERVERLGLGARPLTPEISYQINTDGGVPAVVQGDNDTRKLYVLGAINQAPTAADVLASGTQYAAAVADYTLPQALTPGDRFYVAALAVNDADPNNVLTSDLALVTDVWTGPTASGAAVSVGSVTAESARITFDQITLAGGASLVEVYYQEHTTQPAPASIAGQGAVPIGAPIRPGTSLIRLPVLVPGHWLLVTFVAVDAQNRVGGQSATAVGQAAGTVTLAVQSAAVAPAAPNPVAIAAGAVTTTTNDIVVTLPSSGLPAQLQLYRNGTLVQTVAASQVAQGQQTLTDTGLQPGLSYVYKVVGISAQGVASGDSNTITMTTQGSAGVTAIPQPAIAIDGYDVPSQTIGIYISPAAGTPDGVIWVVEHSNVALGAAAGAYSTREQDTALSIRHTHAQSAQDRTEYLRVYGKLTGWQDSPRSAAQSTTIPRAEYK